VAIGGPAPPFGEGSSGRLGERETSPDTARDTRTQAAALAELRDLNQRRARLIRNLSRVYSLELRPIAELVINLAARVHPLSLLEGTAQRYADKLDPCVIRALGGDDFPVEPLRLVRGS
jgi:hypothetical protein